MAVEQVLIQIVGSAKALQAAVNSTLGNLQSGFQSLGKSITQSLSRAAHAAANVIAVQLGAALTFIILKGAQFQDQMMKTALVAGGGFDELSKKARELGATTAFTATQAARGMYDLASAGFDTAEIIDSVGASMRLAGATGSEMYQATGLVTRTIRAFGLDASESTRITDIFSKSILTSQLTMHRLTEAMKYAAPVGASFGMSVEDTAGSVALLVDILGQGTMAGTAFRMAMAKASRPSRTGRLVVEKYGLQLRDTEGKMKSFVGILEELAKTTIMPKEAMELFGVRAGAVVRQISVNMQRGKTDIKAYMEMLKNSAGSTQAMYDKMMTTVLSKWKIWWSKIVDIALSSFDMLLPYIDKLLDHMTIGVTGWVEFFKLAAVDVDKTWQMLLIRIPANLEVILGEMGISVLSFLGRVLGWIANGIKAIRDSIANLVGRLFNDTIFPIVGSLVNYVLGMFNSIFTFSSNAVTEFLRWGQREFQRAAVGGIEDFFWDVLERMGNGIVSFINHIRKQLKNLGKSLDKIFLPFYYAILEKMAKGLQKILSWMPLDFAKRWTKSLGVVAIGFESLKIQAKHGSDAVLEFWKRSAKEGVEAPIVKASATWIERLKAMVLESSKESQVALTTWVNNARERMRISEEERIKKKTGLSEDEQAEIRQQILAEEKRRKDLAETKVWAEEIKKVIKSVGKSFLRDFVDRAFDGTFKLRHALRDLLKDLAKAIIKARLLKIFGFSKGTSVRGAPVGAAKGTSLQGIGYQHGTSLHGSDTIPAMLTPGEIVLNRSASDVFRSMARTSLAGAGGGGNIQIVIPLSPSLLGSREQIIELQTELDRYRHVTKSR